MRSPAYKRGGSSGRVVRKKAWKSKDKRVKFQCVKEEVGGGALFLLNICCLWLCPPIEVQSNLGFLLVLFQQLKCQQAVTKHNISTKRQHSLVSHWQLKWHSYSDRLSRLALETLSGVPLSLLVFKATLLYTDIIAAAPLPLPHHTYWHWSHLLNSFLRLLAIEKCCRLNSNMSESDKWNTIFDSAFYMKLFPHHCWKIQTSTNEFMEWCLVNFDLNFALDWKEF